MVTACAVSESFGGPNKGFASNRRFATRDGKNAGGAGRRNVQTEGLRVASDTECPHDLAIA
jgi:hypothetical protein